MLKNRYLKPEWRLQHQAFSIFIIHYIFILPALSQQTDDYRSQSSGIWSDPLIWQRYNGAAWVNTSIVPDATNGAIVIQNGHQITIQQAVSVDQLYITAGATLSVNGNTVLTMADGTGTDLVVNGTFEDNATQSINWLPGSAWEMVPGARFIKTTNTSSNNWQTHYAGGIAGIPATANWILRKTGAASPSLSSVAPSTGSVYPNLIIENLTAGTWTTSITSSFTGFTAGPTVKGTLDIGGTGTTGVIFSNQNTNPNLVKVNGDLLIRAGSRLKNSGTGFSLSGNLKIEGSYVYSDRFGSILRFCGNNTQTISGNGLFACSSLELNKPSGDLVLSMPVLIDRELKLISGKLVTDTLSGITIGRKAGIINTSPSSYITGSCTKYGSTDFLFPVGDNGVLRPCGIEGMTDKKTVFRQDDFENGCASGCGASIYNGPLGSWSVTSTGTNDPGANGWFISQAEFSGELSDCPVTAGNGTLHIGNISNSPNASAFCISGDCGAVYDAGPCATTCIRTDIRVESPAINCSGRKNTWLTFRYMEAGDTTNDNATLWYYDGTQWLLFDDMPKTGWCSVGNKPIWKTRTVTLPSTSWNNPSVKIGFRWENDEIGLNKAYSFAVDHIRLYEEPYSISARYMAQNPAIRYGTQLVSGIHHPSLKEYWYILANEGDSLKPFVRLTWDSTSGGTANPIELRVLRLNSSIWENMGNGNYSGNAQKGSLVSMAKAIDLGPFTLGSLSGINLLHKQSLKLKAKRAETGLIFLEWEKMDSFEKKKNRLQLYLRKAGKPEYIADHISDWSGNHGEKEITEKEGVYIWLTDTVDKMSSNVVYVPPTGNELDIQQTPENNILITGLTPSDEISIWKITGEQLWTGRTFSGDELILKTNEYAAGLYLLNISGKIWKVIVP